MKPSFLLAVIAFCFFLGAGAITIFTNTSNSLNLKTLPKTDQDKSGVNDIIYKDIDFEVIWTTNDVYLGNPYKVLVKNEEIYIQDYNGEKPIPIFNNNGTFNNYISKWGKGPGELGLGYKLLGFLDTDLIVYDDQTKRLLLFNPKSGNVLSERVFNLNNPLFTGKKLIDKATIPYPAFSFGVSLNKNLTVREDTVVFGDYQSVPELRAAKKNHLLKQGPSKADNEGNIFFAFHDATLILGFSEQGEVIFKTDLPYGINELPNFVRHQLANVPLTSPNRDEYPKHYIGLSVDKKFIYGLYSGFQVKTRQDFLEVGKLNEGKILNVFNKQTNDYLFSVKLPHVLRDIAVTDNAIYAISVNPEVKLIKYRKPEIFK